MTCHSFGRIVTLALCAAAAFAAAGCDRSQPGPKPITGQGAAPADDSRAHPPGNGAKPEGR